MEKFLVSVTEFTNWLWGWPMIGLLAFGSVIMSAYLGFFQFKYFPYIMKSTFGNLFAKPKEGEEGTVSAFKAMISALGATIGAGNIVGVGVAIGMGGPGAVFWMWACGIFASAFKYSEIALAIKYRRVDENGEYVGGPMYYLRKIAPWFGTLYAAIFAVELLPSVANQAASISDIATVVGIPKWVSAILTAAMVILVVYGGIKRLADTMDAVVPIMTVAYFAGVMLVLILNYDAIPAAIVSIFTGAFSGTSAVGGFAGASVAVALRWGLARGVGSNDAGNGQSAIAHSAAMTDHPGRQGMWGIFEVILDTLIVCTLSALAIIVTGVWETTDPSMASTLAAKAFQSVFGDIGAIFVNLITFLFCVTTIIVVTFYGEKLVSYLFGNKVGKSAKYVYTVFTILGAFGGVSTIIYFLDILFAGMIIPNVIGLFLLRKEIKEVTNDFFGRVRLEEKGKN